MLNYAIVETCQKGIFQLKNQDTHEVIVEGRLAYIMAYIEMMEEEDDSQD